MRMYRDGQAYEINLTETTEQDLIRQLPFLKDWGVFSILGGCTFTHRSPDGTLGFEGHQGVQLCVHPAFAVMEFFRNCGIDLPGTIRLTPDASGTYYTIEPITEEHPS